MMALQNPEKQYELKPYKGQTKGRIIAHFGYTDNGNPFYVNLSDKSHIIIAGEKGSGKTTFLHAVICSIIQIYTEDSAQFVLMTGQKSGFSNYRNIPHIVKIAVLKEEVILNCLKDVSNETEHRYRNFTSENVSYKHLFFIVDGFSQLSIMTKMKAIQYLRKIIELGVKVNVHLIITFEDTNLFSVWSTFIDSFPNRIVFASSQHTRSKLIGTDATFPITYLGEGYALLANSPCLHFQGAKPSVTDIVKPYNDQAERRSRQDYLNIQRQQLQKTYIDQLDSYQFEEFVAQRMRECGYTKVQVTSKSGDYGADVLGIDPKGRNVCVQCKKYTGKVGFDAVQQINTARTLFHCERALLVTTSTVTQQARETAKKLKVELYEKFYGGTKIN